jgi:hypothetical protein
MDVSLFRLAFENNRHGFVPLLAVIPASRRAETTAG